MGFKTQKDYRLKKYDVYLVKIGKVHKIGCTVNIERRLSQLKKQYGECELVFLFESPKRLKSGIMFEKFMQSIFWEKRIEGELFDFNKDDIKRFEYIAKSFDTLYQKLRLVMIAELQIALKEIDPKLNTKQIGSVSKRIVTLGNDLELLKGVTTLAKAMEFFNTDDINYHPEIEQF